MSLTIRKLAARLCQSLTRKSALRRPAPQPRARLGLEQFEAREVPALFVVNSVGDLGDSNRGNGIASTGNMVLVNNQLVPEVTLRSAIEEANSTFSTSLNPTIISFLVTATVVPG